MCCVQTILRWERSRMGFPLMASVHFFCWRSVMSLGDGVSMAPITVFVQTPLLHGCAYSYSGSPGGEGGWNARFSLLRWMECKV